MAASSSRHTAAEAVAHGDGDEGHRQQEQRHAARRAGVERLRAIVDREGHRAGFAGNVAADHQHHAEFAERVRKRQHGGGQHAGPREREFDARQRLPARHPAAERRFAHVRVDRLEGALDRLHRERRLKMTDATTRPVKLKASVVPVAALNHAPSVDVPPIATSR